VVDDAPTSTHVDGFGRRNIGKDMENGEDVELLDLVGPLVEHSGFVTTLAERVARLSAVRHASYTHLRRLDRPAADQLQLVSDFVPGWRLSEMLEQSNKDNIAVDITVVIGLLRQLLPAVALFGRHNRDAAIGTLSIERLIVTPQSRLVIAEHAFGPAIEKLNMGRDRFWKELRVAMPPSAGLPRSNQRSDAYGIGMIALSLLLGRPLTEDEFPAQLEPLVQGALEYRDGAPTPLSKTLSNWLQRALQFDARTAFQAPSEAQLAFESVLASDKSYVTNAKSLEQWVQHVGGTLGERGPLPDPEVAKQQAQEREQDAEAERQRQAEREQEEARAQEREAELARLRELERARAEEVERLKDQERQRAAEVEKLREQEKAREQEREKERQAAKQREQELERQREQERQAEQKREQERQAAEQKRELERQAADKKREQERLAAEQKRDQERQRELERERERVRMLEQSAAAAAAAALEEATRPQAAVPAAEEDPIAAQIAAYKPSIQQPVAPAPEEVEEPAPAAVYEAPAYEAPAEEAPAQESPAYAAPAAEPAYAQQSQPAPSSYTTSDEPEPKSKMPMMAMAGVIVVLLGAVGWFATRGGGGDSGAMRAGEGELAVESRPPGARVIVDGKEVGVTPATVRLPSGPHVLELQVGKLEPRVIPLTISAGVQTRQSIELQEAAVTGSLSIRSEPSGARISIDGLPRGTTPATIPNLAAGTHTVVLELGGRKATQTVKVDPGSTAQLVVPIPRR
jgi:PEGA domain